MKLNGISKIDPKNGDYVVLTDYGMEGISVSTQSETLDEAIGWMCSCGYSNPQSIVKLVDVKEVEDK